MGLRIDLVISYWILTWYLLYILNIIHITPKLFLIIGLFENFIMLLLMFYYHSKIITIINFIIINIFIKVIPYYTVRKDKITFKSIKTSLFVFIAYCIWLLINNESLINYQQKIANSLIYNKNETPAMLFISKYFRSIQ
jgi:hypothetical protein